MIYIYIDENHIKLLYLKKTMLGQFETVFFEKKHETQLMVNGKVTNTDLLASAVKEALTMASSKPITDKDVYLVLPQGAFQFLRSDIPTDIAPSALTSFIRDKARSSLSINVDSCISDLFIQESNTQKYVTFYAMDKDTAESYRQVFSLIDLKITALLPDTLAYFKLFDKTLRKEKKENIFYVFYEKDRVYGYVFDSYGLLDDTKWYANLSGGEKLESVLKEKAKELEEKNIKLNRVVLSGGLSETVRQDTFTKAIGVWTNPLKKIISTFYNDYLKVLLMNQNKQFPILSFDVCFGAFIFRQENKSFTMLRNGFKPVSVTRSLSLPKISLPLKEIAIFIGSFIISFGFFILVSKTNIKLPQLSKPTVMVKKTITTPIPSPTPTPSLSRADLKIKILNGSGTAGKASDVKDILTKNGYQNVLTGNADSFDYKQSVIEVKKSKSEATSLLESDLKNYVRTFKVSALSEDNTADVILVVGSDFQ